MQNGIVHSSPFQMLLVYYTLMNQTAIVIVLSALLIECSVQCLSWNYERAWGSVMILFLMVMLPHLPSKTKIQVSL